MVAPVRCMYYLKRLQKEGNIAPQAFTLAIASSIVRVKFDLSFIII